MKGQYVKLGFLALLFICLYSSWNAVQAEVVWSDDFNDGDYDGWGIQRGNWSADNNYLRISNEGDIYHPSAVSKGTWSFDVYVTPTPVIDHSIHFMLDAPVTGP